MRRSRRSSEGDRVALVKGHPMGDCTDTDNHDTADIDLEASTTVADHAFRLTSPATWCAGVRACLHRRRRCGGDKVGANTQSLIEKEEAVPPKDGDVMASDGNSGRAPRVPPRPAFLRQRHDGWRRVYADAYGVDPESGDPLDHAILRRIGASWRFLWECRQPINDVPHAPGAIVQGQCLMPNGDLVRGTFCVRRLPLAPDMSTCPLGPTLSPTGRSLVCDDSWAVAHDAVLPPDPSSGGKDNGNDSLQPDGTDSVRCQQGDDAINCDNDDNYGVDRDTDGQHPCVSCARIVCPLHPAADGDSSNNNNNDGDDKDRNADSMDDTSRCAGDAPKPGDKQSTDMVLVPHGHAAAVGVDGSLIEGAFCMGLLHGHGRTVDARGEIFGRWRHGRLHGRAVATTPEGWFVCATWRDGRLIGDYFAQSSYGEQFRCASCVDGRFDGRCRRGYACGDWAIEQWADGAFVGIEQFRIAPVADMDGLVDGALLADCAWTCDRVRGGGGSRYDGHIYYPADPASPEFALFCAYMTSEASSRAFTAGQREAFVWAMWMAQRRAAAASSV
ncbi:hypothetical protein TW95_gp0501 [Pandoravirus inopinatum]|uniref:DUF5900 domain-containing protein n=1 Tax=Pandoravirus inopinatum TaxID=1605721 RepID=A0A0B5J684_9VIRU|nr:hypothetical protein TW95_gp0501 [Pandoravirus inopinatum]AJF97235.1 hypothetical protein [Pandoravirus inopinatum]